MDVLIVEDDALHRAYLNEAVRAALPECDKVLEAANGRTGESWRGKTAPPISSWICR